MDSPDFLRLPDVSDIADVKRHREAVFHEFASLFELTDSALREGVAKAADLFSLLGGTPDAAVHAMNTRYIARLMLGNHDVLAEESAPNPNGLDLQWVPNCGLYFTAPKAEFRVLKSGPAGVPRPTSITRSRYYCSNQMLLNFEVRRKPQHQTPLLMLVLLWDVNEHFKYGGMEVACPKTVNSDGTVDCYWMAKWERSELMAENETGVPPAPGGDLDEIKLLPRKTRAAKA